jgi:hypothetical protein
LATLIAAPALAQSPADAAFEASSRLQDARTTLDAAQGLSDRVTALTQTVRANEDGLAALRDGLRRAAIRQRTLETDLAARSDDVARLLGVLRTMDRAPAPILMLHPSGPTGTARSGMMLVDVPPALQDEVSDLRSQLDELTILKRLQTDALNILEDGLDGAHPTERYNFKPNRPSGADCRRPCSDGIAGSQFRHAGCIRNRPCGNEHGAGRID